MKKVIFAILAALISLSHAQTNITVSPNIHSILQAPNYAAVRSLLDLEPGVDFLSISASAAAYQPLSSNLTAWASLSPSSYLNSSAIAAGYQPLSTNLNLWSALSPASYSNTAAIAAAYQPLSANLTSWSSVAPGSYLNTASIAAAYQPLSSNLTSWSAVAPSAYLNTSAIAAAYQPLDSDLTAIGGLVDPNADRILFWDDSAGAYVYLTTGTGLSISGTTITANANLPAVDLGGGNTFTVNTAPFDTISADRTFAALPTGVNGDRIEFYFDVTGDIRNLNFHTNSTVYRVGDIGAVTSALAFPVGNHAIYLAKANGKWWITDSSTASAANGFDQAGSFTLTGAWNFNAATVAFGTFSASTLNTTNVQIGGVAMTSSAAELNALDGIPGTLTPTEIGYVDGVTSAIQTQIDAKAPNSGTQTGVHTTPSTTNPLSPTWTGPMHTVWYGVAGQINLPAAAGYTGRGLLVYNTGAFIVTIDPTGSEVVVRDGTVQTGGVSFTLSSGAGNFVALLSDGNRWVTLGYKGTLALGS